MKVKVINISNCLDCPFSHKFDSAALPGCDLVPEPSYKFCKEVEKCLNNGILPECCPLKKEIRVYTLKGF